MNAEKICVQAAVNILFSFFWIRNTSTLQIQCAHTHATSSKRLTDTKLRNKDQTSRECRSRGGEEAKGRERRNGEKGGVEEAECGGK